MAGGRCGHRASRSAQRYSVRVCGGKTRSEDSIRILRFSNKAPRGKRVAKGRFGVIELENTTKTRTSATQQAAGLTENTEARWSRSIYSSPHDRLPCSWRRHVRYATATVLGYLISLAARDPERFVWARWRSISANAYKIGEKAPGRSQTFAILAELERNGIIARAVMFRRNAMRRGFIVHDHTSWTVTFPELGICSLLTDAAEHSGWEAKAICDNERRRARKLARATVDCPIIKSGLAKQ
jgi:hypothetical protein